MICLSSSQVYFCPLRLPSSPRSGLPKALCSAVNTFKEKEFLEATMFGQETGTETRGDSLLYSTIFYGWHKTPWVYSSCLKANSGRKHFIHIYFPASSVAAIYSDSVLDKATHFCNLNCQEKTLPSIKSAKITGRLPIIEITCHIRIRISDERELLLSFRNPSQTWTYVPLKYLKTHFTASQ